MARRIALSPRLRGEGRVGVRGPFHDSERKYPPRRLTESPPHPHRCAIRPLPHAGRGTAVPRKDVSARGYPRVRPGPPLTAAAASRANRSITRRTCAGSHIPGPVAVGTQRLLSAVAMPYHDVTPLRRSSATMGANCDARASARAMRTLRPASPVLDFPVTAMASRGRKNPRGGGSVEGKLAKWRAVSTNFRLRADATATCRRTWYCRILRADGCFRSGAIPTVEPGD
jgi:hypothetical protein